MCCFADARSVRVFILDWRCFGISKVQHQLNEEITDKEIRLIGENGEQLDLLVGDLLVQLMLYEEITDKEIRLIGENGEQLGIVSGEEALRTAEEQGLW